MEKPFLYKYQPARLAEFELEDNLHLLLTSLIELNMLNILFIGESGCGKTSLINTVINEYYGTTHVTENILYINNLKEQGISYYRTDVKTFCQTPSSIAGKKKVLVVDDIDFINEQSQQVFRNYIDKYSHNVHFIGSCINAQKVIDSLQSRLTIVKKRNLEEDKMIKIINTICAKEHIKIEPEVVEFVISISNKSIRMIINYLEKFKLLNCEITTELANQVCTNISWFEFNKYTQLCKTEHNLRGALDLIYTLSNRGYSVMDILDNYFIYLKMTPLLSEEEKYKIIPYICKYITIFNNVHEDEIELAHFTNNLIDVFAEINNSR